MIRHLENNNHLNIIQDELGTFLEKKPPDCILYGIDGSKFEIHKECFSQTRFMRKILATSQGNCCRFVECFVNFRADLKSNLARFLLQKFQF